MFMFPQIIASSQNLVLPIKLKGAGGGGAGEQGGRGDIFWNAIMRFGTPLMRL